MNRKLVLLNLALLAVLAYAGWQLRVRWAAAKARAGAELSKRIKPLPPPPFALLPAAPPVVPATYAQIAQQDLFDRSRNPTVEVVVPPPPPPKPMPPLPVYHGQMNIGSGPMAILSEKANTQHQALHAGESIGQFKLVDVTTEEIDFEWEGKVIRKKVDELLDRTAASAAAAAAPARTEQPSAPAPTPVAKSAIGPGADTGRGFKVCDPNDNTPVGTVVDGYRKTENATPFGKACRWDPVGR
ncbi:MAG TPA: hypothetical protein VH640_25315 [Bryobacteraceae bacterium]